MRAVTPADPAAQATAAEKEVRRLDVEAGTQAVKDAKPIPTPEAPVDPLLPVVTPSDVRLAALATEATVLGVAFGFGTRWPTVRDSIIDVSDELVNALAEELAIYVAPWRGWLKLIARATAKGATASFRKQIEVQGRQQSIKAVPIKTEPADVAAAGVVG